MNALSGQIGASRWPIPTPYGMAFNGAQALLSSEFSRSPIPAPYGTGQATLQAAQPNVQFGRRRDPSCPMGLEYLASVDRLLVKQNIELIQVFFNFETNNKYELKNSLGQQVYFAAERTNCCTRQCCGSIRPFEINISDISSRVLILARRPLRCQSCCYPCCLQELEVFSPPGNRIGIVEQNWTLCSSSFTVYNASHQKVLKIEGPCNTYGCCCNDINFSILTLGGEKVGCISKQWTGFVKEMLTNVDHFSVSFHMDMDVKLKATLLATAFLIDFMYYEQNPVSPKDLLCFV